MADLGAQRGTVSFAMAFGGVVSALFVPLLGWMMDRWSIRRVALSGLVIYALAMGLLGLSPASWLVFTILFALAEGASSIQTPIGYAKAISAWFDRRRGLAAGIDQVFGERADDAVASGVDLADAVSVPARGLDHPRGTRVDDCGHSA